MQTDPYLAESDELGILGACLLGGIDTSSDALGQVTASMVVSDQVRDSLAVIETMVRENSSPSLETIGKAWSRVKGKVPAPLEIWMRAMDTCPSAANLDYHVQGVREAYHRRKLREAAQRLISDSANPMVPLDAAVSQLEAGIAADEQTTPATNTAKTVVLDFVDETQARFNRKGQLSGITTGIQKLDSLTDGIQPKELFLIAARPSIGKTAMAVSITESACVNGHIPTLFVTCEMSERSLMRRLVSSVGNIPMQVLKTGDLNENDFKRITAASAKIAKSPLHFLDVSSGARIGVITAAVRRAVRRFGVRLVVLDYLQKVSASSRHEKRTYEVAEVSGALKACAVSSGVAMVCLAQLNRESEKDKGRRPRLSDLADSGQIERDADTVCLLDRNRSEPRGDAQLIIGKQRDGECGVVPLWYEGAFCRFEQKSLQDT